MSYIITKVTLPKVFDIFANEDLATESLQNTHSVCCEGNATAKIQRLLRSLRVTQDSNKLTSQDLSCVESLPHAIAPTTNPLR